MANPIIENIRRSLGRASQTLQSSRPDILPARQPGSLDSELEQFLREIARVKAIGRHLDTSEVVVSIKALVSEQKIRKATLWNTALLQELSLPGLLRELDVELVPPTADKISLAQCDLGITEADFLLPETGSVVLRSSAARPRAVSLLPTAHLVIASPQAFRPDLHQVFAEAKKDPYLVFITGPSRTGDIEMVETLGVHGPKNLYVWLVGP